MKAKDKGEKKTKGRSTQKTKIPRSKPAYSPAEDEIRRKANDIYNLRKEFDIEGIPEDDWYQAEKLLVAYSKPSVR